MTEKVEKNCQSCKHHSSGYALDHGGKPYALDHDGKPIPRVNGEFWKWQECTKSWGKPDPVGVLKNMCGLYIAKKG